LRGQHIITPLRVHALRWHIFTLNILTLLLLLLLLLLLPPPLPAGLLCYMLLLSGRSPSKILFTRGSGRVFQLDLLPLYGDKGTVERIEVVPYRLTRNLATFFTAFGVEVRSGGGGGHSKFGLGAGGVPERLAGKECHSVSGGWGSDAIILRQLDLLPLLSHSGSKFSWHRFCSPPHPA
jgi:hypothetical protein